MKGQSNSVIAGSPRNAFRCSVVCFLPEVEHWIADGPDQVTDVSQTPNAGNCYLGKQSVGDNVHWQEGNNPDRQLRSPSPV